MDTSYRLANGVKTHDPEYHQYLEASSNLQQKIETRESLDARQIWTVKSCVDPAEMIKSNLEVQMAVTNYNKSMDTYNLATTAAEASQQQVDQKTTAGPSSGPSAFGSITISTQKREVQRMAEPRYNPQLTIAEPVCNPKLDDLFTPSNFCFSIAGIFFLIAYWTDALNRKHEKKLSKHEKTLSQNSLLLDILVNYKARRISLDRARHLLKRDFRFDNHIIESLLANI